jgi:hypothetical protein
MRAISTLVLFVGLGCQCGAMAAGAQPQISSEISYLSGGVGADEQQSMLAARHDYNLQLTFATKVSGAYLADVPVTIRDRSGAVVAAFVSTGPLCYVKLAPGSYRILASLHGKELSQSAVIQPHRARELYFYWDPQ